MNKIYMTLIILWISFAAFSCQQAEQQDDDALNADELYIDTTGAKPFLDNRLQYTINKTAKKIAEEKIRNIFHADSTELVNTKILNYEQMHEGNHTVYQLKERVTDDNIIDFVVFKHLKYAGYYQVEYPLDETGRLKMNILISIEVNPKIIQSAYIKWTSKSVFGRDSVAGIKISSLYTWDINKTTDTIWTNLSLGSIKKLYPEFHGKYIHKMLDSIIINYNYSTHDYEFYNNIKFIG